MRNAPNKQLVTLYQSDCKGSADFQRNLFEATNPERGNKKWEQILIEQKQEDQNWTQSLLSFGKRIYPGPNKQLVYNYAFGKDLANKHRLQTSILDADRRERERKLSKQTNNEFYKSPDFDFNYIRETQVKSRNMENRNRKRRMSLRDISLIGQKQSQIVLNQTDIGHEFCELIKFKPEKKTPEDDALINQLVKFHMSLFQPNKKNSIASTLGGEELGINIYKDLSVNQQLNVENVPYHRNDMSLKKIMEIAKGVFTPLELEKMCEQKKLQINASLIQKQDLDMEQKVAELKNKIRYYIKLKDEKKRRVTVENFTQTSSERIIASPTLELDCDVHPILFKISTLQEIKDKYLTQNKQGIIVDEIHNKIDENLFNLLCLVVHGAKSISLRTIMMADSKQKVEYQLVKLLLENMDEIEGRVFKGGQSKAEILNYYLITKTKLEAEGGPKFLSFQQVEENESSPKQERIPATTRLKPLETNKAKQNIFQRTIGTPKQSLNASLKFNRNITPTKPSQQTSAKKTTPQTRNLSSTHNFSKKFGSKNSTFREVSPFNKTNKLTNKSFENTIDNLFRGGKSPVKISFTPPKMWK